MELNLKQAYLAMYNILQQYHNNKKNDDELGDLLYSMEPSSLSEDFQPADPETYLEWENVVNEITVKELMSCEEAFQAMILFLEFYQYEYYLRLEWLLAELSKRTTQKKWISAVENVLKK